MDVLLVSWALSILTNVLSRAKGKRFSMKEQDISLMTTIKKSATKKLDLLENSPLRFIYRSILACLFLAIGTSVAVMAAEKVDHFGEGLGKFVYAFLFSISLVMILYMNAELGTSNMMYTSVGTIKRVFPWGKGLKVLTYTVLFNFVGAVLVSFLLSQTMVFQDLSPDHYLFTMVDSKLAKDPMTIFIEAIFANIIVNTAVFCTLRMRDDAGRVISTILVIFVFAFLGFEHVIANFASFSLAFFSTPEVIANMTVANVVTNFTFAFLGNFVGGAIVIGAGYAWLNTDKSIYVD